MSGAGLRQRALGRHRRRGWGGGDQTGKTHPGSAYREFQQEALELYHRGVLLALCSKNNEQDVWEVFERHSDMVLRREHIAAARINWRDKAASLREFAAELNLGLDSLVYARRQRVRGEPHPGNGSGSRSHPSAKGWAVESRDRLAACGWFETLTFRRKMPAAAPLCRRGAARKLRTSAEDMESYFASLEMKLEIKFAGEFSIPRIAQLTQKTNQFNLTTRRYSELDIRQFGGSRTADDRCRW